MRFIVALSIAIALSAQEPRFGAQSRLVVVPVNVTDAKDRPIDGLEASAFTLLDNGKPRPVTVDTLGTGVAPISLVIAVQASGISAPVLEKVREVAGMIKPLITGERGCAAILAFAEQVEWKQDCTRDEVAIRDALYLIKPQEHKSARLLDAVQTAIKKLNNRNNSRRVLLLISESRDRNSETDLETAVISALNSGVSIYALTYSAMKTAFTTGTRDVGQPPKRPPPQREPGQIPGRDLVPVPPEQRVDIIAALGELARMGTTKTTDVLAERSGGTTFSFATEKGLENTIQKLSEELHSQYVLSFTPEEPAPGYHRLEVRVNKTGVQVRARPGYWSAAETP
jgi:VWFA-related protein